LKLFSFSARKISPHALLAVILKEKTNKGKKLRTVLITFPVAVTKYLTQTTSKEEEFILAHGFRDFSP
jgi:hypothetical protein